MNSPFSRKTVNGQVDPAGGEVVELVLPLPARQLAALERLARRRGQPLGQLLRDLLRAGLRRHRRNEGVD